MLTPAEKQTAYRKNRRSRGLCGWKGCPTKSGDDYHCAEHRKAHAERMKRNRLEAKAAS